MAKQPQCSYKNCIVPQCRTTSIKNPEKAFLLVPQNEQQRMKWMNAIRRNPKDISLKTVSFVCEDHFDLENDMENFIRWKLVGGKKYLKKNVIPHRFYCQNDSKRKLTPETRPVVEKRKRKESVKADEQEHATHPAEGVSSVHEDFPLFDSSIGPSNPDVGIQVNIKTSRPRCRSVAVHCKLVRLSYTASSSISKHKYDAATSLFNRGAKLADTDKKRLTTLRHSPNVSSVTEKTTSDYGPSTTVETSSEENYAIGCDLTQMSKIAWKHTRHVILKNPQRNLGIPKECDYVIGLLEKHTKLELKKILLVFKKIRLSETFAELGYDFGVSESVASRMFSSSVVFISYALKDFIVWPAREKIKLEQPSSYRIRFSNVESIIDCFEIEIQKPSDPIKQSLSGSEHKKANTMKYLISCTPNGVINFISKGFSGRTSDADIVEKSGFLEKLKPGTHVMADRGFKHIDQLLHERQCKLVRSPSIEAGVKMSQQEIVDTKIIASLREMIERIIPRIREFKILRPHAFVDIKLLPYIDHFVTISCGLINCQSLLLKTQ